MLKLLGSPIEGAPIHPMMKERHEVQNTVLTTWRLLCRSFLIMTCFRIRGYDILPKTELHRSLQVWRLETLHQEGTLEPAGGHFGASFYSGAQRVPIPHYDGIRGLKTISIMAFGP